MISTEPILIPPKVANPTKPFGVARTLFKNKEKLIEFLENFEVRFEFFEFRRPYPSYGLEVVKKEYGI